MPEPAPQGWSLYGHSLRNAAWAFDVLLGPDGSTRPGTPCRHDVTLAIIARACDRSRVIALLETWGTEFSDQLVLFDADGPAPDPEFVRRFPRARRMFHPVSGDFAAQRNRLQQHAGPGWVLQLDTDETPSRALLDRLGWLTAAADQDGIRSLGLPRRNFVDGHLSALYPDIQYRLNRGSVRFRGAIHERPDIAFEQTALALCAPLQHHLTAARVRQRTRQYAALSPDGGRPGDETDLLDRSDPL